MAARSHLQLKAAACLRLQLLVKAVSGSVGGITGSQVTDFRHDTAPATLYRC